MLSLADVSVSSHPCRGDGAGLGEKLRVRPAHAHDLLKTAGVGGAGSTRAGARGWQWMGPSLITKPWSAVMEKPGAAGLCLEGP